MRGKCLSGAGLMLIAASSPVRGQAFTQFLDGSTLPGAGGWTVDGDPGAIVDLGAGNSGIRQTDNDPGAGGGAHGGSYDEFYLTIFDPSNTLAARFRLDEYSGSTPRLTMLALTPGTAGGNAAPAIGIGVRNINGADRWVALRFLAEAVADPPIPPELTLADLGPVVLGDFNEALIHIDNPSDLVRITWNGVEVYNAVTPTDWSGAEGFPEFGASNYWGEGGTSTVTYDWVGYGPGYVPEPAGASLCLLGSIAALSRRRRHRDPGSHATA